uniref:CCHC-type domain-containing protein n=1 Tax=Tanacetum cinerariifolium TaxID=118510 RepID=A0A6L2MXU6_TANCI|nr:hypothetical protein [Tanacetum cinerariifolium]
MVLRAAVQFSCCHVLICLIPCVLTRTTITRSLTALYSYPLDSGDNSSDEDQSETVESLHTQTASKSVLHPSPTRPLPTSPAFVQIPSSSSLPTLLSSSSLPPPLLLPSLSRKRSRSPSPLPPPLVSPSPLPSSPPAAVPPPPKYIESVGDDIETLHASLASAMQETMALRDRVRLLEQHDVVTRESLRIARGRITRSQLRAEYAEQKVRELREFQSHDRHIGDGVRTRRTNMTEQDIEASRARAEAAEQQAETLHVSLRVARMDVRDLIESREADSNCKRIDHLTKDYRAPVPVTTLRPLVAKQMTEVTCYECGRLEHYKSDCPKWKNQNQVNKQWKEKLVETLVS